LHRGLDEGEAAHTVELDSAGLEHDVRRFGHLAVDQRPQAAGLNTLASDFALGLGWLVVSVSIGWLASIAPLASSVLWIC